jgi:hypothetical protein
MTLEHKVVVGLDDIKAVTLECNQCHVRLTMFPEEIKIPHNCRHCDATWVYGNPSQHQSSTSAILNFVNAIGIIRKQMQAGNPFTILLEFDEPKKP